MVTGAPTHRDPCECRQCGGHISDEAAMGGYTLCWRCQGDIPVQDAEPATSGPKYTECSEAEQGVQISRPGPRDRDPQQMTQVPARRNNAEENEVENPGITLARQIMAQRRDTRAEFTREEWLASAVLSLRSARDTAQQQRDDQLREAYAVMGITLIRFRAAVRALGKIKDGKTLFEHSPAHDQECFEAWRELNDAGALVDRLVASLAKAQPASGEAA